MSTKDEQPVTCEAYYQREDFSKTIVIKGSGRTPNEAFDLFKKVKKTMKE